MSVVRVAADIHLSADCPDHNDRFFRFLQHCREGTRALFLLGDLFDVWIGDDDDSTLAVQTKEALLSLTAAGVLVFIQRGNRDFLLGMKFMEATGCVLLPDQYVLESGRSRWLLMHGDLLVSDSAYLFYRRWLRPLLSILPLSLPQRRRFAIKLRTASTHHRMQSAGIDKERATALLHRHRCPNLVHGHLHQQMEESWQAGTTSQKRFCLPGWEKSAGFAEINDDRLNFVSAT